VQPTNANGAAATITKISFFINLLLKCAPSRQTFGAGYIPFENGIRGFFTAVCHNFYLWLTGLYRNRSCTDFLSSNSAGKRKSRQIVP
jgi:hypothetical protein